MSGSRGALAHAIVIRFDLDRLTPEERAAWKAEPRCDACGFSLPDGVEAHRGRCQGFRPTTNPGRQFTPRRDMPD